MNERSSTRNTAPPAELRAKARTLAEDEAEALRGDLAAFDVSAPGR